MNNNNNPGSMLYDTILSIPGMSENVKLDLKISRKQVLLLCQVIESGLAQDQQSAKGLLSALAGEAASDLKALVADCLEKAGLTALDQKIKAYQKAF